MPSILLSFILLACYLDIVQGYWPCLTGHEKKKKRNSKSKKCMRQEIVNET